MTSDIDDEIALPRFEARVWAALAAEHRARRRDDAFRAPVVGSPHRRRIPRSLAVGGGAVAAAAAVFAAVVAVRSDGGGNAYRATTEEASGGAVAPELATRIIAATEEAAETMVVHTLQDNTSYGDDEMWRDETTGGLRMVQHEEDGAPSLDTGPVTAPPAGDGPSSQPIPNRTVDYCFSEYAEGVQPPLPIGTGSGTEWVQNALERGWWTEDGTQVVDGRELLRFREMLSDVNANPPAGPDGDQETTTTEPQPSVTGAEQEDEVLAIALIDPETYRPVMYTGYPGSDAEYAQTYEYLPRTPENLARLVAPVPEGFSLVDELRSDGDRAAAGCGPFQPGEATESTTDTTSADEETYRAQCAAGSMAACDQLWTITPVGSELDAFARTCGGREPEGQHPGTCEEDLGS
jgi:hypothetical protein